MPGQRRLSGIEIWCVDLASCDAALSAIEAVTPRLPSSQERAPAERAAHIALRVLLERAFGSATRRAPFTLSASGRPSLAGIAGDFSLSHTGRLALIGIAARGPIGVDLETLRPVSMARWRRERIEAAGQLLTPGHPLPEEAEARFLQAWTRLEAFAKARGRGIGHVLSAIGRPAAGSVEEGIKVLLAEAPALAIHDLVLGRPLFAAVAITPDVPVPPVRALPADVEALERLLAADGEQR